MIIYLCMELRPKSKDFFFMIIAPTAGIREAICPLWHYIILKYHYRVLRQRLQFSLSKACWAFNRWPFMHWHEHNSNMDVGSYIYMHIYSLYVSWSRFQKPKTREMKEGPSTCEVSSDCPYFLVLQRLYSLFIPRCFSFMIQPLRDNWQFFLFLSSTLHAADETWKAFLECKSSH